MIANGKHSHILITSEKPTWLETIQAHLTESGYQVTTSPNGADAYTLYEANPVDAVIAVVSMDTIALFEKLRRHNVRTVLILITPDDAGKLVDERLKALADSVLTPIPEMLSTQLEYVLQLYLENQELKQQIAKLSQQVQAHQRLMNETEILKNAIVRNVSHELRTPLLQVKSAVSLIKEGGDISKLVFYAENAVAKLEILVKNVTMLGMSLDAQPSPIILRDAVEYARRDLRRIWQHRDNADRIQLHIEPNLPPVMADKQGLSTVLHLLLDNALKFSEERQTPVEVIARKEGDRIYIAVKDYGIGIAKDKLQKIFDMFYQVDASAIRRFGGMGVGLALVKLILDKHQAEIHVESEEGKGSTFWFYLKWVDMSKDTYDED